jgi:hypothetical protein
MASLRSFLRGPKDAALALTVRTVCNAKLGGIGTMTELSIDTNQRECHVRLDLRGESQPLEIHVTKYDIKQQGDIATITVVDATASREWVTEALRAFVVGRSFTIPPAASAVLKLLV